MIHLLVFCIVIAVLSASGSDSSSSSRNANEEADCTVDPMSKKISGWSLCGDIIIKSDIEYKDEVLQFASTSFAENISPTMILVAECDTDIEIALEYATECGFSVVMRSGGHQYSGLSSCTDQCIQIDLTEYNSTQIIDIDNNIVKAGVGVQLQDLYSFLDSNNLFVPGGATTSIGIGGHFQTGGIGYLLRSFGAFTDSVIGFDIILSDGKHKYVSKDEDLFYAVRGGGPGSFGVITNIYLKVFSNSDYPSNAMGVQLIWTYTDSDARAIAKQWLIFQHDTNYTQYDDFFPLFAIVPDVLNDRHLILIAFIWIDDIDGRTYHDFGKSYFTQQFVDVAVNDPVVRMEIPDTISSLMNSNAFLNPSHTVSPTPYLLRANGVTQIWDDEFIDILIDNVTQLISDSTSNNNNIYINLLFETYGGMFFKNDPNKEFSALPFRDLSMLLAVQLFYTDANGKEYAANYLQTTFTQYIGLDSWNNEDIRVWGYTFGELDMEIERQNLNYFRDGDIFNRITQIKLDVDECNIFQNKFTVPLPLVEDNENIKIQDLDVIDLSAKDMLMIKQWTAYFYYELDELTSTSSNNGDCTDLTEFIQTNTIPNVKAIASGDVVGIWYGRSQFIALFCGLFGPFINEDHFQSTIAFLSYQKQTQKHNKCGLCCNEFEMVTISSKTFIYSIETFQNNMRATYINRNKFQFIKSTNSKKWLLYQWNVDVERVDINNLG